MLHYFGSKAQLFAAVLEVPAESTKALELLKNTPREKWGEAFSNFMIQSDGKVLLPPLLGILRSATSDPKVAQMIREFYVRSSMSTVFEGLGLDHPEVRASSLSPLLAGFVFADQILEIPIGKTEDINRRKKLFANAVQAILTTDLA